MPVFRPFVPNEFLLHIERMLAELSGKKVRAQLTQQKISGIKIIGGETEIKALLIPSGESALRILLKKDRKEHWPVDIGHELGHTFFYRDNGTGFLLRENPIFSSAYEKEEKLCEWFGFAWAHCYYSEVMALLAALTPEAHQPEGIQLSLIPVQLKFEELE